MKEFEKLTDVQEVYKIPMGGEDIPFYWEEHIKQIINKTLKDIPSKLFGTFKLTPKQLDYVEETCIEIFKQNFGDGLLGNGETNE